MRRIEVASSTIEFVGYDEATETLEVAFYSGSVYQYQPVPMSAFRELLLASKVAQWFCAHIQDVYPQTGMRWRW